MLWIVAALAGPEEIVVWQKPFSRFDDRRWLVHSEVVTPVPFGFGGHQSRLRVRAWQLETVVHCQLADRRGSLREVDCRIEDVALRAHDPRARAGSREEQDLRALTTEMVGKSLQLQAHRSGRVPNTDFDGLSEQGQTERRRANAVRAMVSQVSAAFHMELPEGDPNGRQWSARQEPLLQLASPTLGMSSVRVRHRIDEVDGSWIQQTTGRATSTSRMPNPNFGMGCRLVGLEERGRADQPTLAPLTTLGGKGSSSGKDGGTQGNAPSMATADYATDGSMGLCRPGQQEQEQFMDLELRYRLDLSGVSVVDLALGFPTERIWAVQGQPAGSSPGSTTGSNY